MPKDQKEKTQQDLKNLQAFCFENKIKVPWDKVLTIGIYQDLKAILPEGLLTSRQLFKAIGHHVNSPSYLKRLVVGAQRFGIGYQHGAIVTVAEANSAKAQFFKLHAKKKQRKSPAPVKIQTKAPSTHKVTANTLTLKGRR